MPLRIAASDPIRFMASLLQKRLLTWLAEARRIGPLPGFRGNPDGSQRLSAGRPASQLPELLNIGGNMGLSWRLNGLYRLPLQYRQRSL